MSYVTDVLVPDISFHIMSYSLVSDVSFHILTEKYELIVLATDGVISFSPSLSIKHTHISFCLCDRFGMLTQMKKIVGL